MNVWTIQSLIFAGFIMVGGMNVYFGEDQVWFVIPIITGLCISNFLFFIHIKTLLHNRGYWSDEFLDEKTWRKKP